MDTPHDAGRQAKLNTKLTVLQIRTQLLRRRVARHDAFDDADWGWLDEALVAIQGTTRELLPLITDGERAPKWTYLAHGIPAAHLAAEDDGNPN
jgi:hypothetical protein